MTKRTIVLELADDSCSIYCGSCPSLVPAHDGWSSRCRAFENRIEGDWFAKLPKGLAIEAPRRLAACVSAEQRPAPAWDPNCPKCGRHDGSLQRARFKQWAESGNRPLGTCLDADCHYGKVRSE